MKPYVKWKERYHLENHSYALEVIVRFKWSFGSGDCGSTFNVQQCCDPRDSDLARFPALGSTRVFDPFRSWVFSEEKEWKRKRLWRIMYIFFALLCFCDKTIISITVTWAIHPQIVLAFSVHLPFLILCYP
jgi:hypothetical protein